MMDWSYYVNVNELMLPRPQPRTDMIGSKSEELHELPIIKIKGELNYGYNNR